MKSTGKKPKKAAAPKTGTKTEEAKPAPKLDVKFYRTPAGNEPVRDWLVNDLSADSRKKIGEAVKTVQWKWPDVTQPLVKVLLPKLAEVRVEVAEGAARIFYTVKALKMFLLHGIIKKQQKTPKGDLDLAEKRMDEVQK